MRAVFLRSLLVVSLLLGLAGTSHLYAISSGPGTLEEARDLMADAGIAANSQRPIVLFFSSSSCPYCEVVRDLYLEPMVADETYNQKALFRIVHVGGVSSIRDFHGRKTYHDEFADKQGASLTPVIKIYGPDGRELVPEILGYSSPDFYLGFLEDAINNARARLLQAAAN